MVSSCSLRFLRWSGISESPRRLTDRRTLLTLNTTNASEQMVTTKSWTPARINVSQHQAAGVLPPKKGLLMRGQIPHTQNQLRGHNPLARFGLLFKSHFFCPWFAVLVSAVFAARVRDSENFLPIVFPQIAFSVAFRRAERRASGPVGATPLGRAGGREHDILWRQNVSEAAGAAAEHEGRPVESERGRVVARMVRSTDSEKKYAM